jgi:hypothetical protein
MPNPRRCLAAVLAAGAAMLAAPAAAAPSAADDTPPPPAPAPASEYRPLIVDSNVLEPSLVTAADIDRFLVPTPLAGYGAVFMSAEATTGVNARFLVGITWVENNSGRSLLAQTQHNLFSIMGAGGWASYDSFESSILQSADYIGHAYAHPGGAFYRGGTIAAIGRVYAADPGWATKVANAANYIGCVRRARHPSRQSGARRVGSDRRRPPADPLSLVEAGHRLDERASHGNRAGTPKQRRRRRHPGRFSGSSRHQLEAGGERRAGWRWVGGGARPSGDRPHSFPGRGAAGAGSDARRSLAPGRCRYNSEARPS